MGPTAKYFASGCAKYQPLTAAVGYIAKLSVILRSMARSTSSICHSVPFSV